MDDAIATAVGECPLVIRIARTPAAPLLKIIAWPDVLESGIIFDPWVEIFQIAAASILERARHRVDTGFLRLDHGLGLGSIASGAGAQRDVDDLHINVGIGCLKHVFQMLNARNVRPH